MRHVERRNVATNGDTARKNACAPKVRSAGLDFEIRGLVLTRQASGRLLRHDRSLAFAAPIRSPLG